VPVAIRLGPALPVSLTRQLGEEALHRAGVRSGSA